MIGTISDYGSIGLPMVSTELDPKNPATFTLTNASGQGLDRKVEGKKVIYSYSLKEYQGLKVAGAKDKVIHSASSCVGSMMWGNNIYTNGKLIGNISKYFKRTWRSHLKSNLYHRRNG